MTTLHPEYVCGCDVPHLLQHLGEDTGLCEVCGMVYDESLYERRLRTYVAGLPENGDLHEILQVIDPRYFELVNPTT